MINQQESTNREYEVYLDHKAVCVLETTYCSKSVVSLRHHLRQLIHAAQRYTAQLAPICNDIFEALKANVDRLFVVHERALPSWINDYDVLNAAAYSSMLCCIHVLRTPSPLQPSNSVSGEQKGNIKVHKLI